MLICALAMACSRATEPTSPVGAWRLVAIDDAALPAMMSAQQQAVAGTLDLNADGTYVERTVSLVLGAEIRSEVTGRWTADGETVQLLGRYADLPFAGRWSGSTLEIRRESALRYAR